MEGLRAISSDQVQNTELDRKRKPNRRATRLVLRRKNIRGLEAPSNPSETLPTTPGKASGSEDETRADPKRLGSPSPPLSPSTSHPFIDPALRSLSIPGIADVEELCKWVAVNSSANVRAQTCPEWIGEVQYWWGRILWDWCLEEPLIFYLQLELVLDKRRNLLGERSEHHSATAYSRALALLRDRLSQGQTSSRLIAISMTGLAYLALRQGDAEVAETHVKAIPSVIAEHRSDCHVWLYAYWMELRQAGISFRRPALDRYMPEMWPAQDVITPKQIIDARDLALRTVRTFGSLFGGRLHDFFLVFQALHSANLLQENHADSLTRQMSIMYNATYNICCLHADVLAEFAPDDQQQQDGQPYLLELVAVAMKLSVWNVAWLVGPQSGNVQRALLNRARQLSNRIEGAEGAEGGVVAAAARANVNLRALLWVFLVTSAEAYTFQPQSRPYWLNQLRHMAKLLQVKTRLNFNRALQNFPCTAQRYTQRTGRAWDDLDMSPAWSRWREVGTMQESSHQGPSSSITSGPFAKVADYLTAMDFQVKPE